MLRGHTGRLAIVSDAIYPYHRGGKEERIRALSQALVKSGYDVHIYTMKWWDGPRVIQRDGLTLHAIMPKLGLYTKSGRRSIWQAVVFALAILGLTGSKFDVLEVDHMPVIPLFTSRVVAWLKRRPLISTFHEVWGLATWKDYLGSLGYLAAGLEWLSARLPDKIIAVSDQTATALTEVLGSKKPTVVVPNGIDLASLDAQAGNGHTSDVIFVGRLIKHKNVKLLLEAIARLKTEGQTISAAIVGDGPEAASLKAQATALGIHNNVTFFGRVTDDEKYQLMKSSQLFVTPSDREGFGITILEANACGLPVVTADAPNNAGRQLITGANGEVVELTAEALAQAIAHQLARPQAKRQAGARAAAAAYDWSAIAERLPEVYQS